MIIIIFALIVGALGLATLIPGVIGDVANIIFMVVKWIWIVFVVLLIGVLVYSFFSSMPG